MNKRRKGAGGHEEVYADLEAFFKDKRNPSQNVLAEELGITPTHLSMIKWRQREPDIELAIKITRRCRVPWESLIRHKKGS